MKIYTKTGDKGETSLFDGTRVKKTNKRISAYGSVDEVNSQIGLLISVLEIKSDNDLKEIVSILLEIQNNLFVLGSDLANPNYADSKTHPRITAQEIEFLETTIDQFDAELPNLRSFILPGGSLASSHCHIIRTIIRRTEVLITDLLLSKEINDLCLIYINRLSDLFFVLARVINKRQNIEEKIWKPQNKYANNEI